MTFNFAGSNTLVTQIQQGAPADVFASADQKNMDKLVTAGLVETPVIFARNKLEIAVAPGNPKNITSLQDLAKPGVSVVLEATGVPAGDYTRQVETQLGISITPKSLEPDVKTAITQVTSGEVDATVVYVTDVVGRRLEGHRRARPRQRAALDRLPDRGRQGVLATRPRPRRSCSRRCRAPCSRRSRRRVHRARWHAVARADARAFTRDRRPRPPSGPAAGAARPLAAGCSLVVLPLVGLLQRAPWSSIGRDLTDHDGFLALRLSLECSLGALAVSIVLGVPLAWILARHRFPGRALARALVTLPMVLPPVVGGIALLYAFGRRGFAGRWLYSLTGWRLPFTAGGAIVAEAFVAMPFLVITAEAAFRGFDRRADEAAATLGALAGVPVPAGDAARGRAGPRRRCGARPGPARSASSGRRSPSPGTSPAPRRPCHSPSTATSRAATTAWRSRLSLVLLAVSLIVLVALRDRWLATS